MYQQLQSYPTPFLFLKTPPRNYIEASQAGLSLESALLLLPVQRSVTEDFPPNASLALVSALITPPPGPINRSVTEDFPPSAVVALVSAVVILPISRTVTEDFPPLAKLALVSVAVATPITETLPVETANAALSLQSLVV